MTPTKEEIIEKAVEIYMKEEWQNGSKSTITPTERELKEGGYFQTARQVLMCSNPYRIVIEKESKSTIDITKDWLSLVDFNQLLRNGGLILGSSGTGKSDLGMYVAEGLQQRGVTVYVVDSSQSWLNQSNIGFAIQVPTNLRAKVYNLSTIYDTSLLSVRDQKVFVEDLIGILYEYAARNPQSRSWKVLVLEEAQLIYYQGSLRSHRLPFSKQLLTVGRNFGLRYLAISQFSSEVDKLLVKMSGQRWFGWTWEKNDREYL